MSLSAYNDPNFTKLVDTHLSNPEHEDFYAKLVALKTEQKKTLLFMEELYNTKQLLRQEIGKSEAVLDSLTRQRKPEETTEQEYKYKLNTVSAYGVEAALSQKYPMKTVTIGGVTTEGEARPSSKPPACPVRSSVTFQKRAGEAEDSEAVVPKRLVDGLDEGIRKIEAMWDNFSLKSDHRQVSSQGCCFLEGYVGRLNCRFDLQAKLYIESRLTNRVLY